MKFDRSTWTLRTSEEHKRFAKMTEKATTKAAQKKLEPAELFFVPYYDAIRFVVIDPMHNLLLGTARHVFKLWIERGVLSIQKLEERKEWTHSLCHRMLEGFLSELHQGLVGLQQISGKTGQPSIHYSFV